MILARALYKQPQILFLDEATSHLDEHTEALVAKSLRDMNVTRVIVAHRPATIAHADYIYSFENDGALVLRKAPFKSPQPSMGYVNGSLWGRGP